MDFLAPGAERMNRKNALMHCLSFLLWIAPATLWAETASRDHRPNLLLIVADDLGYADLGIHGSDIRTPNIDALAREGLRFTQFHTAPYCAPTRAMLLSGNNNHVAGVGRQHPVPPLEGVLPGYEGHLSDRIAPLPSVLRSAGYHTYTVGKWHLGTAPEHSPKAAGFEHSFGVMEGAAGHFDGRGMEHAPNLYREDGEPVDWPEGAYSTALYTDRLIDYIEAGRTDGKPFFAYVAYTAPHWPLQVPKAERNRYAGSYDEGYDALRAHNFNALQTAGMVPASSTLPPRNEAITPWVDLDKETRRREARKMELYAAMVENLDGHVGRLIQYLKKAGLYDNTLIVFMSDNGAAAENFYERGPYVDYLRAHYRNDFEDWGGSESWVAYDAPWAEAGSAPFKRYKSFASEGGTVAPLIIAGTGVAQRDTISRAYLTAMDIAPTFIELAGARYPAGGQVQPMRGESLLPLLEGKSDQAHDEEYLTVLSVSGQSLVRQGRWKLTAIDAPFVETKFALYDISTDPGETTDLSAQFPEKRAELLALWRAERASLGIVLPEDL